MDNNLKSRNSMQLAYFKYGYTPANKKWIVAAATTACIVLVLILCMLFGGDKMSMRFVLWLSGFAGLFALVSIVCAAVFYYRIYNDYWTNQIKYKNN